MGSAYDFNLLMYFLALRIGTRCFPGYHGPFVATKEYVRRLRGSVSQNLISDLVWTSFAPRSDLV